MEQQQSENAPPKSPELAGLDFVATLMDNRFRIPGTGVRFGLDSLIGLVPGIGDGVGLLVSGFMLWVMLRRGAGPLLMLRMLGNVALDALVGAVPVLGDAFDFGFKANRRNMDLLQKYYADGHAKPSAKRSIGILAFAFLLLLAAAIYGIWKLLAMLAVWAWQVGFGG